MTIKTITLEEFLEKTEIRPTFTRPRIHCKDGFTISIQDLVSPYEIPTSYFVKGESFECGFPSEKEDLLMPYAEDEDSPTSTIYAYVPIPVIKEVLNNHGGIVSYEYIPAVK